MMEGCIIKFIILGLVFGGMFAGMEIGKMEGRIQVASGQYTCERTTNPDLTTEWQCKETE